MLYAPWNQRPLIIRGQRNRWAATITCQWLGLLVVAGMNTATSAGEFLESESAQTRPNVLWFVVDDMSAHFSCYGEPRIETPHVDQLAREGVRFTAAHVTAPVCSTCRSAMMTGMYQTSLGVHNHRVTGPRIRLPDDVITLPEQFRRAGYYTCNGDGLLQRNGKPRTKTDYNFEYNSSLYDGTDWSGRGPNQPFFMQVQLAGGKLRGGNVQSLERIIKRARERFGNSFDPASIELPPYYPDDPLLRKDWAAYLESVRLTDDHVGQILDRLVAEKIADETLIIFMTDHGISHARGKQFNYREGTHIPLVIRGPGVPIGVVRDDLVEHIDIAAVSLAAAGIQQPETMQARNILAPDYLPRTAVYAARDRCDETVDMIRSVRTSEWLYIRNFHPFRPYLQPSRYKDNKDLLKRLRELRNQGALTPLRQRLLFAKTRPAEELYDVQQDPHEINNLADDPRYNEHLARMRDLLNDHLVSSRDMGFVPEPHLLTLVSGGHVIRNFSESPQFAARDLIRVAQIPVMHSAGEAISILRRELKHKDPLIRYWATVGLRAIGSDANQARDDLVLAMSDEDASVRIGATMALTPWLDNRQLAASLLDEARHATDDAYALWALDGFKFLDVPDAFPAQDANSFVKGQYSERAADFLSKRGLVYGSGTDYWNPASNPR